MLHHIFSLDFMGPTSKGMEEREGKLKDGRGERLGGDKKEGEGKGMGSTSPLNSDFWLHHWHGQRFADFDCPSSLMNEMLC